MSSRLVVGNWKMNGSLAANDALLQALIEAGDTKADIAVCVPHVYLAQVKHMLSGQAIGFGAQDLSVHVSGAYTGETSATMLKDLSCQYVIVGHSERRQYHQESNVLVAKKALAAKQSGLVPIICVGETLEQRESSKTLEVIAEQLQAVKSLLGDHGLKESVIAYEPVWAIGTGLTATPEQAQEVHHFIREQLGSCGDSVSLLYGGSVKASNAGELFQQRDIDGALVGGASLIAEEFIQVANA